ncbi:MAG: carboxy terminal-processing peptidase [Elusimicrobia bacterium]|nr:carboxy terminal-processing peptidase [Elusimicrobiota bacterium]
MLEVHVLSRSMKGLRKALLIAAALLQLQSSFWLSAAPLDPGPGSPIVAQMVARILEQNHYNHRPLDEKTSHEMLKNYLEAFDYNHMIFEQADVKEFEARYGRTLADKIKEGDVSAAFDIFDRFLQRLGERQALVQKLTAATNSFDTDESFVVDRHELPWPASRKEAENIWRLRIKYELLQERLNKTKPEEQAKTVNLRYERMLRSYKEFDGNDVLQAYLTALTHTYDPHSDYMAATQMENFNISMRLSLVGIGAVLRSEDGYAKIVSLVPGGPADKSKKLEPNDKIEAIAQGDGPFVEAVGMKLDRLVQLIRGEKGTTVRLRIIPADAIDPGIREELALVRDEIKLTDQEAKAKIIEASLKGGAKVKVGVIDLPSFYADMKSVIEPKSTTRDVEKLIGALKKSGVAGIVLDLRRNGGGSLSESVALTGLFIPEGPVVQVRDARGIVRILRDSDPSLAYGGPLVVLTSRASASASEILAANLQDFGRAVVVGEKSTFGKGTVQSIIELSQYLPGALRNFKPGAVKLTIQKFYRISGGSTQNRGVIPDISLPSLSDYVDATESSLDHAMPYDEIEPSPYQRLDHVTPEKIKELSRASAERVKDSPEFAYVQEDVERFKKQKEEKIISLNEKKRLAERDADEARSIARKKERAARKAAPLAAMEINLQSIDNPAAAPAVVISTAAEAAQAGTSKEGGEYEKAPPTPDFVLEESVNILADLISVSSADGQAHSPLRRRETYIP